MVLSILAVLAGLILLLYSADLFVEGSASVARHYKVSPLLIGIVIVGFGSSAPEMVVSVMAAIGGNPGIALGNAYGSNIANIALILGFTALLTPILFASRILKKELPLLILITLFSYMLIRDLLISRLDGVLLLVVFSLFMVWTYVVSRRKQPDAVVDEVNSEVPDISLKKSLWFIAAGGLLLVLSSRILVWGAVNITVSLGVSEVVTGLTVVALGTSLPELASCLSAVKKHEDDIALGNIIGSYIFNSLLVVGLAAVINPIRVDGEILTRDFILMGALTVSLFVIGYHWKKGVGRINRFEGALLFITYITYITYLVLTVIG
ncbi:MAG: calcium/sodium antiporter [Sphaerochaetaceae bacterium]|nr:calcium/sodium antiporter [Sphaerochaetaceae bacterium]